LAEIFDTLEREPAQLAHMRQGSRMRYRESFTQEKVLLAYEQLLLRHSGAVENDIELVARSNWS
jgi:hypothetical protein